MTYKVVVGVDGSPHSEAALRWALADAEKHGGQVTAVFVWQVPFSSFPACMTARRWRRPPRSWAGHRPGRAGRARGLRYGTVATGRAGSAIQLDQEPT